MVEEMAGIVNRGEAFSEGAVDVSALDFDLAALFVAYRVADGVMERMAAAGFEGLRFAQGFFVQHLIDRNPTVGEVARAQGVTPQAVSKMADELVALGYVERVTDPSDARIRRLALTEQGRANVEAAREARAAEQRALEEALGRDRIESARQTLIDALRFLGAEEAILSRRVRPPR